MKYAITGLLLIITALAQGQQAFYRTYDWEKTPAYHNLGDVKNRVHIKRHIVLDYVYEDNDLVEYATYHEITRVVTDADVETYNKLYIPSGSVIDIMSVKARKIDKNGKTTIANANNLKEADNVEGGGSYKMLPIEGVQEGDEVETIYTVKRHTNYWGIQYLQMEDPTKELIFEIYSPRNLLFECKSYNGLAEPKTDTNNSVNHIMISEKDEAGVKDEKYMNWRAHIKKCAYQFSYNYVNGQSRLYTYDIAAERFYKLYHTPIKDEESALKGLVLKMKLSNLKGEAQLRAMELYLKKNINLDNSVSSDQGAVNNILKLKAANSTMMGRLYCLVLDELKVNFQIVFTSDRTDDIFDGDFNCWAFLDRALLYFPDVDMYMDPANFSTRLGFVPYEYTDEKGLFIKEVELGGNKTGIAKVKYIPSVDAGKSHHSTFVTMDLTKPGGESTAQIKVELAGYPALGIQALYEYVPEDKRSNLTDAYVRVTGDQGKVTDVKVENATADDALVKPMVLTATLTDEALSDHAGDKILLKAGLLIGRQTEMYESKNQNFPADNPYAHQLIRRIDIKIPAGSKIENPEAANIHAVCMGDDGKPMAASSNGDQEIPSASGWLVSLGVAAVSKLGHSADQIVHDSKSDFVSKGAAFDAPGLWIETRYLKVLYGGFGFNFLLGAQEGREKIFVYSGLGCGFWY